MVQDTQVTTVEENKEPTLHVKASGEPTVLTDEFDEQCSTAGQECKQLFVEGLELKVRDSSDNFPGGTVEGLANAFGNVDFHGEVMKRGAFRRTIQAFKKSKKGMPLMDNHRIFGGTDAVIGSIIDLKETPEGLFFKAFFSTVPAAQAVRTKIREGVLNSLSIGFNIVKKKLTKDGILELLEVKLREVSVVVFPANELATVTDVKSAVRRIAVCPDTKRDFDEAMALKRWREYCGKDVPQAAWGDAQWAKFAGAFTIVDNNAPTQAEAFKGLVLDVVDGAPQIVHSAVTAAIEQHGKNEFLTDLAAKFETPTEDASEDDAAQSDADNTGNKSADEPETTDIQEDTSDESATKSSPFDSLRAELDAIERRKALRGIREVLDKFDK